MPMYEVEHVAPLSHEQQDKLAERITGLHTEIFSTPRLFVNVRFTNISHHVTYVAGHRVSSLAPRLDNVVKIYVPGTQRNTNRIIAYLRHGPARTRELYDKLCAALDKHWKEVVSFNEIDQDLHAIFVLGAIVAGKEAGMIMPAAGEDFDWLKGNAKTIQSKANEGNEDMVGLVHDIRTRKEFSGILEEHN